MSKQWQIRRGTTIENNSFTGAIGELTMDTDKNQLRIHDGVKQGGYIFGDTVIEFQAPTAENGYTWYRLYRSGWVEQGGFCSGTAGVYTVNLPIEMADGNYSTIGSYINENGVNNTTVYSVRFFVRNTNSFTCDLIYDNGSGQNRTSEQFNWRVSGMAA